jgi:hypothetical protein
VAVWGSHHRDVTPHAVESDGSVRPKAFDLRLSFQLHAELGEERDIRVQVVDDDADVVHPLNRHVSEDRGRGEPAFEHGDLVGCQRFGGSASPSAPVITTGPRRLFG